MDWFNQPEGLPDGRQSPLSVAELSAVIGDLLDDSRLQDIRVSGEITSYKHHGRGHRYFSLSDKGENGNAAIIKCVMWRSDADRLPFIPEDGIGVIVTGSITHYAPHGAYQLQVKKMEKAGLGGKYLQLEQWKRELAAEGLFSPERKRCLPRFPLRVGVVTSETGAVIHDIRNVIGRRYPIEIIISPTAVQGDAAYTEIAEAIRRVAGLCDVMIIARGGGSFEDLFPFNHPDVVRAIAACPVPVVSAVGHEVDITLSDLVADIRAPTPSAAAELVVPDRTGLLLQLAEMKTRLATVLQGRVTGARDEVRGFRDRLRPQRFMNRVTDRRQQTADLAERLERAWMTRIERERLLLSGIRTALEAGNPMAVLGRGYCVAEKDGIVVKRAGTIAANDRVKLRFYDGSSQVIVERVDL